MTAPGQLRERLVALAGGGLDAEAFGHGVCAALRASVPFDFACLATADPATGLITGVVKTDPGETYDAEIAGFEYGGDDVNLFAQIARRPTPVGVLGLDTAGVPERSARFRELLAPRCSFAHELRAVFRSNGLVWGMVGLYRSAGAAFTHDDVAAVAAVSRVVADGERAALLVGAASPARLDVSTGPAVLVLDAGDRVASSTAAGRARVGVLGGSLDGPLPMPVLAVVAAARAQGASPTSRVRAASGEWMTVHAARLSGGDVAVAVEPAGPAQIVPLVVAAYGLTGRESDVVARVLHGASTEAVARSLHLSPWTVQDHLRSIFAKMGVANRRELVARVFVDQYGPRIGTPISPTGWFASDS